MVLECIEAWIMEAKGPESTPERPSNAHVFVSPWNVFVSLPYDFAGPASYCSLLFFAQTKSWPATTL